MMLSRRMSFSLGVAAAAAVLGLALPGLAKLGLSGGKEVTFHAVGPAGLAIEGTGFSVKLRDNEQAVDVIVGLGSLKTGIGLRDRHMREKYLETHKYPTASLRVEKSAIRFPSGGKKVEAKGSGKLTLHGVTRPVNFTYRATGSEQRAAVEGKLRVKMTDYGITIPSYLGVTVKPDVDVAVKFQVTQ